jgi:hypothetical protein
VCDEKNITKGKEFSALTAVVVVMFAYTSLSGTKQIIAQKFLLNVAVF